MSTDGFRLLNDTCWLSCWISREDVCVCRLRGDVVHRLLLLLFDEGERIRRHFGLGSGWSQVPAIFCCLFYLFSFVFLSLVVVLWFQ